MIIIYLNAILFLAIFIIYYLQIIKRTLVADIYIYI